MKKSIIRRHKNSPDPIFKKPVYIQAGRYLNLTDYARSIGVTRLTAYALLRRGIINGVQVGPKTVLIKVKELKSQNNYVQSHQ